MLETRTRNNELDRGARERYAKHVKAIVQVGERRTDTFGAVLGYPAEIVALTNPYALRAGEETSRTNREVPAAFLRYLRAEGAADLAARLEREGKLPADSMTRRTTKFAKTLLRAARARRRLERSRR